MRTDRAIEAFAALCGIVGTLLLAARGPHAGWGFVLFLGSNAGWLVFSWRRHWYLFAQQVAFTGTSLFGIWRWLL